MRITRIAAVAAAIALSLSLSACSLTVNAGDGHGDGHSDKGNAAGMMDDSNGMMDDADGAADLNMSDVMFVQMMIPHHEQAVEMASFAPTNGASPEVQALAAEIAAAQGPEITQMEQMLDRWGVQQMMDHSGHQMDGMISEADLQELEAARGPEFDRLFLEAMIEHHEGAISMAQDPLANGEDAELQRLLGTIVATQTAEIAQMKQMLAAG